MYLFDFPGVKFYLTLSHHNCRKYFDLTCKHGNERKAIKGIKHVFIAFSYALRLAFFSFSLFLFQEKRRNIIVRHIYISERFLNLLSSSLVIVLEKYVYRRRSKACMHYNNSLKSKE
jgi:hypothetical protein